MQTQIEQVITPDNAVMETATTHTLPRYCPEEVIFFQGDPGDDIYCVKSGEVMITMATFTGKEAIVGILGPGAFFGEEALAGRRSRVVTATALTACTLEVLPRQRVHHLLRHEHDFRERFVSSLLSRTIRLEHDLGAQMLSSAKHRLARTLLLLAGKENSGEDRCVLPMVTQERLAGMVGTTRGRINRFMNEFKRHGIVAYDHTGITVKRSLLRQVPESDLSTAQ